MGDQDCLKKLAESRAPAGEMAIGAVKGLVNGFIGLSNTANFYVDAALSLVTDFQFGQMAPLPMTPTEETGALIADVVMIAAAVGEEALISRAARTTDNVVDVMIDSQRSPQAAAHIQDAQAGGQPSVLTLDRARARPNRAAATQGYPRAPRGFDNDEYPPACCQQGGAGASVRPIPRGDNRSAGAQLGNQIRTLPDGRKIRVRVQ
jgi:hypothetical protein